MENLFWQLKEPKEEFVFSELIQFLREKDDTSQTIENYEKIYGKISDIIEEQIWYKDYVSKFTKYYRVFKKPSFFVENDYSKILYSLCVASFSSDFFYSNITTSNQVIDESLDLEIVVNEHKKGFQIKRKVSELKLWQIVRLLEIYCNEQINLQLLLNDEKEGDQIRLLRNHKIRVLENYYSVNSDVKDDIDYIYHYTSVEVLEKILKNRTLRFTHIKSLNDKREYHIWFEIFDKALNNIGNIEKESESYIDFLKGLKREIDSYKNIDTFISSFSITPDLLSQWRAYGNNGKGICLGFKRIPFLKLLFSLNDENDKYSLLQGQLDYNYKNVYNDTFNSIQDLLFYYQTTKLSFSDFINNEEFSSFFQDACRKIWMRIQDAKDPSFFEEKEFRLFWNQIDKNNLQTVSTFTRGESSVVRYIELNLGNSDIYLKKIIIGPTVRDREIETENIINVLTLYNINVDDCNVEFSKIPYKIY